MHKDIIQEIKSLFKGTPYEKFHVEYYGEDNKRIMIARYNNRPTQFFMGRVVGTNKYEGMLCKINLDVKSVAWGTKYHFDFALFNAIKRIIS